MPPDVDADPRQRRTAVRVEIEASTLQIWLSRLTVWSYEDASILNISAGGALVEIARPLPQWHDVRCRFRLPGSPFFSFSSTIVRVLPVGSMYQLGLRFTFRQEGLRDPLVRWIFEEIARRQRHEIDKQESAAEQLRLRAPRR